MLPSVSMSNLPKLRQLHCYQNPITELDVSPFENLWYLFCGNTGISQIDVSRNPQLRELRCENTHLTSIDVSKCENLTDLFCNKRAGYFQQPCIGKVVLQQYRHKRIGSFTEHEHRQASLL